MLEVNTLKDLSNKVCVPNKTNDLNLSVFSMTTGINKSKTLIKHISRDRKRGRNRTCFYFNDTIKFENFDLDNILIDKKSYGNILVHKISY